MSAGARVLVYVQHLKGIGHLRRAAALSRALDAAGMQVTLVSGGLPVAGTDAGGAEVVQLPPARAGDDGYAVLVDAAGMPVDERWRERRRAALLAVLERVSPRVLLIESFPFGRRKLRFELVPLLERARAMAPAPLVVSSLRDLPEPRERASEREEMVALASDHFDWLLVHGDPAIARLEDTFPEASRVAGRVRYTGYLAHGGHASEEGHGEVVVSAGGGVAGAALLAAARGAGRRDRARTWRVLVGPNAPPEPALAGGAGVIVEPIREDFAGLLENCLVSVSQAGYNTMVDVVRARCRAVVVPHDAGGEREQGLRARRFSARGLVRVLPAAALDAARLLAAVDAAAAGARPPCGQLSLDGARRCAELVSAWAGGET